MKIFMLVSVILVLTACGPRRPGKYGNNGLNGNDGTSSGVHIQDATSLVCSNGGVVLSTFSDLNSDGILDLNEPIRLVKTLCNGINGSNGVNASVTLETIAPGIACVSGGVMISSNTSSPVVVCNGSNGLNGLQGIQGVQGLPGIQGPVGPQGPAGVNGTTVVPVKLCSSSTATYPEYGLKIGNDLFAVFWNGQAFMTKLVTGNYTTTTGSQDCNFSIP